MQSRQPLAPVAPFPPAQQAYSCGPPSARTLSQILESLVWVVLAGAALFYGNGEKDAIDIVRTDERVNQQCIVVAGICALVNAASFVYVFIYMEKIKGLEDPQNNEGRPIVAVGAVSMVAGGISLMIGIWPVWGILTPFLVFVLFMGFIMSLQYLPTFGVLRVKPDAKDEAKQR